MPILRVVFDIKKGVIIPVLVAGGADGLVTKDEGGQKEIANPIKTNCLIDTGADRTCLNASLIKKLGVKPSGMITMTGATGNANVRTYFVSLIIPIGNSHHIFEGLQVAEYSGLADDYEILLGRDILSAGIFQIQWDGLAILGF